MASFTLICRFIDLDCGFVFVLICLLEDLILVVYVADLICLLSGCCFVCFVI